MRFLEGLQLDQFNVLEIGGGASTFWFDSKCKSVTTIELDARWSKKLKTGSRDRYVISLDQLTSQEFSILDSSNSDIVKEDLSAGLSPEFIPFANSFIDYMEKQIQKADLIFVDGGPRNLSMKLIVEFNIDALVVVDNTDLNSLSLGLKYLNTADYLEIPFRGLGPLNPYAWTTSFFVKDINRLRFN